MTQYIYLWEAIFRHAQHAHSCMLMPHTHTHTTHHTHTHNTPHTPTPMYTHILTLVTCQAHLTMIACPWVHSGPSMLLTKLWVSCKVTLTSESMPTGTFKMWSCYCWLTSTEPRMTSWISLTTERAATHTIKNSNNMLYTWITISSLWNASGILLVPACSV